MASAAAAPAAVESVPGIAGSLLPPLERAEVASRSGDATAMQARYDAARALVEALRGRASPDCPGTVAALSAYARANVDAAEAFDRHSDRTGVEARVRATGGGARRALSGCAAGRLVASGEALEVPSVSLPRSATLPVRAARPDARLDARLAGLAHGFNGYSAILVRDLASGRTGGWNVDARFPAASTVKLGVVAASLRAAGAHPERSSAWYDLEQLTGWSSNLAANRLYESLGRSAVEATLRRLGASSSTYPGVYRVGTAHGATPPVVQPPLVSQRVTTARDLAAVLETIHRAAFGDGRAIRTSGLSRHQARLALGLLLAAKPAGENAGLFQAALPAGMPVAQKNGWLSDAYHTAAILYTPHGPVVCVLLTYRGGLTRAEAMRLGAGVVGLALGR